MKKNLLIITVLMLALNFNSMSQQGNETLVLIKTDYGDMTVMLYNDTPKHRDNFIKLIKEGWYEGSIFHRVIQNFMIQGGASAAGQQDPGYTVEAEFRPDRFHKKGALSAARQGDDVNPDKRSSGCQFYIVQGQVFNDALLNQYEMKTGEKYSEAQRTAYKTLGGTPHLDGGYTVFGEVIIGFEVIDKIAAVTTAGQKYHYKPLQDVKMSIEILE